MTLANSYDRLLWFYYDIHGRLSTHTQSELSLPPEEDIYISVFSLCSSLPSDHA